MSDNALPREWKGTDILHERDIIGGVTIRVMRECRDDKRGHYWWHVVADSGILLASDKGVVGAAEARADGLAAVEAFARKLLEETAKLREAPNE